jgi:hypothetical protein
VGTIILAAITTVAIVVLLLVVNARLNPRSPELQDHPRKPDGPTTCGSPAADWAGVSASPPWHHRCGERSSGSGSSPPAASAARSSFRPPT